MKKFWVVLTTVLFICSSAQAGWWRHHRGHVERPVVPVHHNLRNHHHNGALIAAGIIGLTAGVLAVNSVASSAPTYVPIEKQRHCTVAISRYNGTVFKNCSSGYAFGGDYSEVVYLD